MARFEIQKWITGYAIRDTEDETYVRDHDGSVSVYTLGDLSDLVWRMNRADDIAKAEESQEAYMAEWDQQERDWEDYSDAMGYDPMEYVNAEDYAAQNR